MPENGKKVKSKVVKVTHKENQGENPVNVKSRLGKRKHGDEASGQPSPSQNKTLRKSSRRVVTNESQTKNNNVIPVRSPKGRSRKNSGKTEKEISADKTEDEEVTPRVME